MTGTRFPPHVAPLGDMRRLLIVATGVFLLFGIFLSNSVEGLFGYLFITVSAVLPMFLWARAGALGLPILPAIGGMYWLYFAVPTLRENYNQLFVIPGDILRASATVALFLVAATGSSWLLIKRKNGRPTSGTSNRLDFKQASTLIYMGIVTASLFQLGLAAGWFDGVGSLFGVLRAVLLAPFFIACFLSGYYRAQGQLRHVSWAIVVGGITLVLVLSWSSLFLVAGMQYLLALTLGFVVGAKRLPWKILVPAAAVLFVLHAGKGEMREKYWAYGQNSFPLLEMPVAFTEWFGDGIDAIMTGDRQTDIFDRASLLSMLLFVQQLTPDSIPYLGGETYALIGSYFVPRFLEPDKTATQAGMTLLNIHYALQTEEATRSTAIGWGIVPEAFANFGYGGVLAAGLLFGGFAGLFMLMSSGATPLSLNSLIAMTALVSMTNIEADAGNLLVTMWQSFVAVILVFGVVKLLQPKTKKSTDDNQEYEISLPIRSANSGRIEK